jgi:branched-chain amino acid transport system ATP-binding protein
MSERTDPGRVLVCRELSSGWGDTQVLDRISLSVAERDTTIVLGRNGTGKTTLLSTLIGRASHKAGSIVFCGRAVEHMPPHVRARLGMGFVPQEREIFRSLSVAENLTIGARPGPWSIERVFELFPRLAERSHNRGNQLSGGEQQMLAIARALVGNPRLMMMDEPLEGLAPVIVDQLVAAIQRIRRESDMSIILVEQHVDLALEFSDRVLVLDRGAIVYSNLESGVAADRSSIEALLSVGTETGLPVGTPAKP